MLTMSELLESSIYRRWLEREPLVMRGYKPPWRLFVQKEQGGRWATKDFEEYSEAIKVVINKAHIYHDMAIVSRRKQYGPPTINKGGKAYRYRIPDGHVWCGYCRRPTVFRTFARHHAFTQHYKDLIDPEVKRCSICGIRQKSLSKKL